jgi:hypothetical protein
MHTGLSWSNTSQTLQIGTVEPGWTILRTRFQWGMFGVTSTDVYAAAIATNFMLAGIVTTVGNGTESVPSANAGRGDADPPTQRWLWWEGRVPHVTTWDAASGVATWELTLPDQASDSKGMVLATGIPSGDTLNMWFSWQADQEWDPSGSANLWLSYSILTQD